MFVKDLLTTPDFFDPRMSPTPMERPKQYAETWKELDDGAHITTVYSMKDAIGLVRYKYRHCGAMILVAGSAYQAGAAGIILGAGREDGV